MVKLEETTDRRRLHIGSYFVDLNETDYQELIRIFSEEERVKNLSSNLPVMRSVCECKVCGERFDSNEDYYYHYDEKHNKQTDT